MEYLKLYEDYNALIDEAKKELIEKMMSFIKKYDFERLFLNIEENDKFYNILDKGGFLNYEDYKTTESEIVINIKNLNVSFLKEMYESCDEGQVFTVERVLEMSANIDEFKSILKNTKEPIEFNAWMFGVYIESDKQDEINNYDFQKLLFETHPESISVFLEEIKSNMKILKENPKLNWEPIKLDDKIKEEYSHLLDSNELGIL